MIPLPLKAFTGNGMIIERKAQSAVWGLLSILVLVVIAGGLVDIYRLYAARNWAYSVAQEAACWYIPREGLECRSQYRLYPTGSSRGQL